MSEYHKGKLFAGITILPAMSPVIIIRILDEINAESIFIAIISLSFLLWVALGQYNVIFKVSGYLKNFLISMALLTISGVITIYTPEKNNAFAGAFLFLFLPCGIYSWYLLNKSKSAIKAYEIYSNLYDKKT